MTVLVYRDPVFLAHDPGEDHPENARRLAAVYESLDADPMPGVTSAQPRAATLAEIERIHAPPYVEAVARTAHADRVRFDADTATSRASYEAACKAAGGTIQGVEAVLAGEARGAFALVRPPGHHAEAAGAMGFCLFNNTAIAAKHALAACGLRRVLVVDPDVHHGNGTQHAFWDHEEVLYISSHRFPFFPGTGAIDEIGGEAGRGYTLNLPLRAGAGDADVLYLYERIADPLVRAFHPELILVSAGFDTWKNDPLGGLRMTENGFRALYALFRRWADRYCPGRIVCTLEGGYDPAGVVIGVRAAIEAMAADAPAPAGIEIEIEGRVSDHAEHTAYTLWRTLPTLWPTLAHTR